MANSGDPITTIFVQMMTWGSPLFIYFFFLASSSFLNIIEVKAILYFNKCHSYFDSLRIYVSVFSNYDTGLASDVFTKMGLLVYFYLVRSTGRAMVVGICINVQVWMFFFKGF